MTSRAILCRDAAIVLLNTDTPIGIPEAGKRWTFPGEPLEANRIAVFLNQEPVALASNSRSPIVSRDRMLITQLTAISDDAEDLDDQVEVLRAWVVKQLGNTDLGKLALSVEERGILEPPLRYKLDRFHIIVHEGWNVRYQTKRDDLEAAQ